LIAVDTSVVVAAFATWHQGHEAAAGALARRPRLPAHALVESYSVLTRLPAPHTAAAPTVGEFLRARFSAAPLILPANLYRRLLDTAQAAGISGGAIYDALIAATAKNVNAVLLTRDRRAVATYEKIGARFELIA
jgi:predicted nucleic acid-binding protein